MRRGFTLIELLVVVAIIAILATIAVPNFLEAQIRAKVAHAEAEMQTIGTALEAYRIDHEDYPGWAQTYLLTSPIAYISDLPKDLFPTMRADYERFDYEYVPVAKAPDGSVLSWQRLWGDWWAFSKGPTNLAAWEAACASGTEPSEWILHWTERSIKLWELKSWGPNHRDDYSLRYSPTNGTISSGDVCRFGP